MAIEITDGSTQNQYSITANGSFDQDEGELTMDLYERARLRRLGQPAQADHPPRGG